MYIDSGFALLALQRWEDAEERERLKEELRTVTETIDKMITTGAAAVVCSETMICNILVNFLLMYVITTQSGLLAPARCLLST
jgi:hypothetical protein